MAVLLIFAIVSVVPSHAAGGRGGGGMGGGGQMGGGMSGGSHWSGSGHGGGHWHGGWGHHHCCFSGTRFVVGFGFAGFPWWGYPAYPYPAYPYPYPYPYAYPYPPASAYAPPTAPVYYQQASSPAVQREVSFPNGKYVLYGNGVNQPWQWIWVPAPAAPPPPPAAPPLYTRQRFGSASARHPQTAPALPSTGGSDARKRGIHRTRQHGAADGVEPGQGRVPARRARRREGAHGATGRTRREGGGLRGAGGGRGRPHDRDGRDHRAGGDGHRRRARHRP